MPAIEKTWKAMCEECSEVEEFKADLTLEEVVERLEEKGWELEEAAPIDGSEFRGYLCCSECREDFDEEVPDDYPALDADQIFGR